MEIDPSFWAGKRVLVTGHTGFKGAWLCLWLSSMGARVSGLAPGSPTQPSLFDAARVGEEVGGRAGDVRDLEAVSSALVHERPEIVFHLAAQPMVRRSLRQPRETFEINVMGTINVLEAARLDGGVQAIVVVTSDKCYENTKTDPPRQPFVETDPMGGSDPYSSSKGCAELVTAAYRTSYFSSTQAARVASARAGNVIGGGDWGQDRLIPDLIRAAEAGAPVRVRNPDAVRPWQHVLNPLSGYLILAQALCEHDGFDEGWNFGPPADDARPVRWIADRLTELWPGPLSWQLDQDPNPPEASFLALSFDKARQRLAWRAVWDLDQALQRIVDWHVAHHQGADMRAFSIEQLDKFQSLLPA